MTSSNIDAASRRPRQIRVRILIAVLLLLAVALPVGLLLAMKLRESWNQRRVVNKIEQLGGDAYFDYQLDQHGREQTTVLPKEHKWLRQILGDDFFHGIHKVDLGETVASDDDLTDVVQLVTVEVLDLRETKISDRGLKHLEILLDLKQLDVRHTAVTEEGVDELKRQLPNLAVKHDSFWQPNKAFVRRTQRRDGANGPKRDTGLGQKREPGPSTAVKKRDSDSTSERRPSLQTEESIERGMNYLAHRQQPDGSWALSDNQSPSITLRANTAATGLVLLTYLGAGYDHTTGRYKGLVSKGLNYLISHQHPSGDLYLPDDAESSNFVWLYSHGIATVALCEAYGMTQDYRLREPAQRAIDFAAATQHVELGGWRYRPGFSSDTSVTGWLMMALKSGQLSGLDVPAEAFTRIETWLDRAQASKADRHLYVYNPEAEDTPTQRHGRRPNQTMTSVGLLMRLYLGWQHDNPHIVNGAKYLLENLPRIGSELDPQRDSYYWYYATQVMVHMPKEDWQKWNRAIHRLLVQSQLKEGQQKGSWDPLHPVPDRWAPHAGRTYVTTLNLLTLEVYYRHLPLCEKATN